MVLAELEFAVRLLSPYLERRVLRRISMDLLDTYVGRHTGRRILEGRVERGAVEQIDVAIWFADLRGFTALSETSPISQVLAILNDWFDIVGEVIAAHGGEILKFMGDAVLAIFLTSVDRDRRMACRRRPQDRRPQPGADLGHGLHPARGPRVLAQDGCFESGEA